MLDEIARNSNGLLASACHSHAHSMPFGAALLDDGTVRFRIFAPDAPNIQLALEDHSEPLPMSSSPEGWHELITPLAQAGTRYTFILPDGTSVPDPASRYQPRDVAGPSEVIDPASFKWHDGDWLGTAWTEAILYELHIGAFTPEGTFAAATSKLRHLADLGVTAIELMSIADFAGNRNWGYDGVLLYAPDSAYGAPDCMRAFVDAAHTHGLSVILDVVYNHFGPEGNFIPQYFRQLCSDRHKTPWGKGINFDGPNCSVVRDFIIHNALYWMEEFHIDGLRLDAAHTMLDDSPTHILEELQQRVKAMPLRRPIHLLLEFEDNIADRVARDPDGSIPRYTAQWNYDISHLPAPAFGNLCSPGMRAETRKIAVGVAEGFTIPLYKRGELPAYMAPPTSFIAFLQTHDLVGNRPRGDRITSNGSIETVRALASIYLLGPQIPMLFMGEEWAASTPFPFFCDYHGELGHIVREGRCKQLEEFDPPPSPEEIRQAPDPQAESTFRSTQLNWNELSAPDHADWLDWYRRIIATRHSTIVPLLSGLTRCCSSHRILGPGAFTITWTLRNGTRLHLAANLCDRPSAGFPPTSGDSIWQQGPPRQTTTMQPWSTQWSLESADTPNLATDYTHT